MPCLPLCSITVLYICSIMRAERSMGSNLHRLHDEQIGCRSSNPFSCSRKYFIDKFKQQLVLSFHEFLLNSSTSCVRDLRALFHKFHSADFSNYEPPGYFRYSSQWSSSRCRLLSPTVVFMLSSFANSMLQ